MKGTRILSFPVEHCTIKMNIIMYYLLPNSITIKFGLVWFGLVWFNGISTIVDYLMSNPTYILNI